VNSQARLIFNAGREGVLPRWIGRVEPSRQVPRNAIFTFVGIASVIIGVWALGHLIFGHGGSMDGLTYFDESGTMGTILVLVVYFLANLGPAVLLPEVPAGRVQRDQARGAAGARDDRDRRPRLLPVQARAVGALQLVPVCRAGHPGRFGDLRRRADQA
jgi:amino acid transporter